MAAHGKFISDNLFHFCLNVITPLYCKIWNSGIISIQRQLVIRVNVPFKGRAVYISIVKKKRIYVLLRDNRQRDKGPMHVIILRDA